METINLELVIWLSIIGYLLFIVGILLGESRIVRRSLYGGAFSTFTLLCLYASIHANQYLVVFISIISLGLMTVVLIGLSERYSSKDIRLKLVANSSGLFVLIGFLIIAKINDLNSWVSQSEQTTALNVLAITIGLVMLRRAFKRTKPFSKSDDTKKKKPSVTLAIPARNETHALSESLESALAINYPKLEILVLDDCSQDKTPSIIKSFAHSGVRFIAGKPPGDKWLGKNYAMQQLLDQASGELILFAGVDVRFKPDSIDSIVSHFRSEHLDMMSVMPQRQNMDITSNLLQPLRYFWEVVLAQREPAMSSVWLAKRSFLTRSKAIEKNANEMFIEQQLSAQAPHYEFAIADSRMGITTRKRPSSQVETAMRTVYPRLGGEVALAVFGGMSLAVASWAVFSTTWAVLQGSPSILGLLFTALLFVSYAVVQRRIQPRTWLISALLMPLQIVFEIGVLLLSIYKYEFDKVGWKDRDVCIPVFSQKP